MIVKNIYKEIIAKTQDLANQTVPGISLFSHSIIVGIVCQEFIKILPKDVFEKYDLENFPFFAAIHDIGKASPGFQEQLKLSIGNSKFKTREELEQKYQLRHENISYKFLERYKSDIFEDNDMLLNVIKYHHGYIRNDKSSDWGDDSKWNIIRNDIYTSLNSIFEYSDSYLIDCVKCTNINDHNFKFHAGLLSVSDWIGSDENIFNPNDFMGDSLNIDLIRDIAKDALGKYGFLEPTIYKNLSFEDVFKFVPKPIQTILSDNITCPGVYVVEAPMGYGKTEAAEYAAYIAIQRGICNGIYFALPTQTTSNVLFDRYRNFVERISDIPKNDIRLTHSKSSFHESMSGMHSWFGGKRSILSKFALGTIDQAIMSVVPNYRHFFIRTFGLNKKVVIFDEVHSYDVYTSKLMKEMIDELVSMDCVVILLSATLTNQAKKNLCGDNSNIQKYPLITKVTSDSISYSYLRNDVKNINVKINIFHVDNSKDRKNFIPSRLDELNKCLNLANEGKMVLWIENTVKDSQEVFSFLNQKKSNCGLLHSKFTTKDRMENENYWIDIFGKEGKREVGCILVGTQVCEQSLDIDADYLVTAICPSDMLCQRLGRLHRHERKNRNVPECTILSDIAYETFETNNVFSYKQKIGSNAFVYSPYILRKTHFVWKDKKEVCIPKDIRNILEETYLENNESEIDKMLKINFDMVNRNKRMEATNAINSSSGQKDDDNSSDVDDDFYSTRDIQLPTIDVILCKEFSEKNFITLYDKYIETQNKFSTEDIKNMNECSVKISSELISKESNVFKKIKFGKNIKIFCLVKNENVLEFDSRMLSKFTYTSTNGFS